MIERPESVAVRPPNEGCRTNKFRSWWQSTARAPPSVPYYRRCLPLICKLFCNRFSIQMLCWSPMAAPAIRLVRRQWASAMKASTKPPVSVSGGNCIFRPSTAATRGSRLSCAVIVGSPPSISTATSDGFTSQFFRDIQHRARCLQQPLESCRSGNVHR